jgi:hypothetical protein
MANIENLRFRLNELNNSLLNYSTRMNILHLELNSNQLSPQDSQRYLEEYREAELTVAFLEEEGLVLRDQIRQYEDEHQDDDDYYEDDDDDDNDYDDYPVPLSREQLNDQTLQGDVEQFNEQTNYSQSILCRVCFENIKDIRLNCGHMLCKVCARILRQRHSPCPICRVPTTSYDKIFYNKYLKYKTKYLQLKNKIN